jgi:hypothetical protein
LGDPCSQAVCRECDQQMKSLRPETRRQPAATGAFRIFSC